MQRSERMLSAIPRQTARQPAPEQKGKTFEGKGLLPESQGQNLVLTVLYVPRSGLPDTPQRALNERTQSAALPRVASTLASNRLFKGL